MLNMTALWIVGLFCIAVGIAGAIIFSLQDDEKYRKREDFQMRYENDFSRAEKN